MYETEANIKTESPDQIPQEVRDAFAGLSGKLLRRSVLPWSEHCTECVWPTCYTTCDLYSPREDGRCRRFVDGMVRIECPSALNRYLLKIRFKQWGKLWTPGNIRLRSLEEAAKRERRDYLVGTTLYRLPVPAQLKKTITSKRYGMKKRFALRGGRSDDAPTSFLVECFNPLSQPVAISLTVRSFDKNGQIPFQRLIDLQPGVHVVRIPFEDISKVMDVSVPFNIELIPNEIGREITLYFGLLEFVEEVEPAPVAKESTKIKCVVWDLDNTLWDGILVEDGLEKVRINPEIVRVIKELDQRGILQSIASKNNFDDAMRALAQFEIAEFFLCPQISWAPKAEAIGAIAAELNIGVDSMLFVDDSQFELQQVKGTYEGVRVLNATDYTSILEMKECQVPVTMESKDRRRLYQVERIREGIAHNFKDSYEAFLRQCEIHLRIGTLTEENLERVHELTQRTNQMNFSGNRYDRELLEKVLRTPHLDTYVLSCEDRFGTYGIIGFGLVDRREPRLTDLMFSCRVQSKRVEHAFLGFILRKYIARTGADFQADYRKTPRNLPSGQVFSDIGMQEIGFRDGVTSLVFPKEKEVPDDRIINVVIEESSPIAGAR